jgi:hypothetical protein
MVVAIVVLSTGKASPLAYCTEKTFVGIVIGAEPSKILGMVSPQWQLRQSSLHTDHDRGLCFAAILKILLKNNENKCNNRIISTKY